MRIRTVGHFFSHRAFSSRTGLASSRIKNLSKSKWIIFRGASLLTSSRDFAMKISSSVNSGSLTTGGSTTFSTLGCSLTWGGGGGGASSTAFRQESKNPKTKKQTKVKISVFFIWPPLGEECSFPFELFPVYISTIYTIIKLPGCQHHFPRKTEFLPVNMDF